MKKDLIPISQQEPFIKHLYRLKYSDNTIETYGRLYNQFKGIKEPTQQDINTFIDKHNNTVVRSFLKVYIRFIGKSTKLIIPEIAGRKKKHVIKWLSKDDVYKLALHIKDNSRNGIRDYLIVILLFETGLRASELCMLRKESFDFENNIIKGIGKGNKEFNNLLFSDSIKPLLYQFVAVLETNERVFKINRNRLGKIIRNSAKQVFPDRTISPHCLRHSAATYLKSCGFDLKDLQYYLRHERLDTVGIYAQVDNKQFKQKWNEIMNV